MTDAVNPGHYKTRGVECIELVEMLPFCEGNAVKYLWRAGLKGPALEDLNKARWYLKRADTSKNALFAHRPRIFTHVLNEALEEFADETQRDAIEDICRGRLKSALAHVESMIAHASRVPPTPSTSEPCSVTM